jgi:Fuc2NAc and GlcNAc transferase
MLTFLLVLFCLSLVLTHQIRKLAIKHQLLDHPNHRSAHSLPTPRGGGLSIVICVSLGLAIMFYFGYLQASTAATLFVAGSLVALAGFLDDKFSLSPAKRLLIQFVAVVIAIYGLGYLPVLDLYFFSLISIYWLVPLTVLYLLWLTNLYNFMDGINGIAGVQAVSVCLFLSLLHYLVLGSIDYLSLIIAVSSAGFLYWNFPKAKIFMGDVGSGYLGLMIGLLSINHAQAAPELLFSSLILMGVFVVDASYTLIHRAIQGKKVHQAHSSHAYQHLARRKSHTKVTLGVLMVNSLWLLPVSLLMVWGYLNPWLSLMIAYAPLIAIVIKSHAGLDESQITKSGP